MPNPDQLRFLIILIPAVLFVFGIKKPVYAVTAYMIFVYCKTSHYYPIFADFRLELVAGVLIIFRLFFYKNFFKRVSATYDANNKYIYMLFASVIVSFLIAWDRQYSWDNAVYHFIKTLLLYVMIVGAIDTRDDLKFLVLSFIGMFTFLAYDPVYKFLMGTDGSVHYYGVNYIADVGILAGHVALANNMNQMIPISWFLFLGQKSKFGRIFLAATVLIFLLALVGSGSRGGVVGLAVNAVALVYFSKNRLLTGFIAILLVALLLLSLGTNITHTANRIDDTSVVGRLLGLTHGVEMVKRGNILGVGPGCFLFARSHYFNYRMESHNIYGEIIGELGIPGIVIFFLLMRQLFKSIFYVKKYLESKKCYDFIYYIMLGVQVSLITRLVISFASHGLYYFYWYFLAGIVVVTLRIIKEENNTVPLSLPV